MDFLLAGVDRPNALLAMRLLLAWGLPFPAAVLAPVLVLVLVLDETVALAGTGTAQR